MAQIRVAAATVWSAILILSACRSLPKQETPALRFPDKQDLSSYNELRSASRGTSYLLARQIGAAHKSTVVHIGPIVSVDSGEIVRSGQDLQTLMLLDLQQLLPGHSVRRLTSGATDNSWFVTGTFRYEKAAKDSSEPWFRLDVNASAPTGQVMPVLSMRVNVRQFDPTPSRFFQDAPMYLLDAHARQRTALSLTIGGQVSPEIRRRFLEIETAVADAIAAYERASFIESERMFARVNQIAPESLIGRSGYYQSLIGQDRLEDAQVALAEVVDAGIRERQLSFRLLFKVGSTDFRDDIRIAPQYPSWLKAISQRVARTRYCLKVVGHTSHTGTADYNESLSLRRARRVVDALVAVAPAPFKQRVSFEGAGFRKNIVGSGMDDESDSVDRRVDFVLQECR